MKKALAFLVITALSVLAQVPRPGGSGGPGGSGATSLDGLTDVAVGASPPGTCTDDHLYLDTSEAIPAERLKICESNVWYKVAELTAGDYIDITGRTISLSTSVPIYSTSTSDGSGVCTAGREWHLNTSSGALWWCQSSGTWKAIVISGTANEITLTGSTLSIASAFDISGKTSTKSVKTGTSAPATCAQGELFVDTDATAASQFLVCTATDTWTAQGGSGSGSYSTLAGSVVSTGVGQGVTRYHTFGTDTIDATQGLRQIPLNRAGTLRNLYVRTQSALPASNNIAVTVQVAGSDTSITCTVAATTQTCSDTSNSAAVSAGDLFGIKYVTSGGSGTVYPAFVISFE